MKKYKLGGFKKLALSVLCVILLITLSIVLYFLENKEQTAETEYIANYTLYEFYKSKSDEEGYEDNAYLKEKIDENPERSENKALVLKTFREAAIIVASILLSSFFSMCIIEKNEKNKIYSEAVSDFFNESECKLDISKSGKANIGYYNKDANKIVPEDLFDSVLGKICNPDEKYYYTDYKVNIDCKIENDLIVKDITETIKMRSFGDKYEFDKENNPFIITEIICQKINSGKNLAFKTFKINNKENICNFVKLKTSRQDNGIYKKMDYNKSVKALLKRDFVIENNKDTVLTISYTTKVPLKDKMFTLHFPCPCKKAEVNFKLSDITKRFKVCGSAFGFIDKVEETYNDENDKKLIFIFEDWSFKEDGVVINIIKS